MTDNKTLDDIAQQAIERPSSGPANIILDATMLTSLMECARKTDFRFNLNLQSIDGKSNSLECGSIVHKFLEVMYSCIIHGMRRDQAIQHGFAAAELYIKGCPYCTDFIATEGEPKPKCGHKANDYPGVRNTPKESEGFKTGWHWVLDTCDQYTQHYINDHWVPLEVEVVKGKVLYEDEDIRILWKAKLDLISDTNQGIFPIDHKTMKQRRDTLTLNNQFTGQCLIMGTRSVFVNKIGFQTSLKPAEKFSRPPVSYSAARLIEWQSTILPYYSKLLLMYAETGYWPPNYGSCEGKYGNCSFKEVCEADPGMREEELKRLFVVGPAWNPTNDED